MKILLTSRRHHGRDTTARTTAAHDIPISITTKTTGPHLSSYFALGSRLEIRRARHRYIHSARHERYGYGREDGAANTRGDGRPAGGADGGADGGAERGGRRADSPTAAAVADDGVGRSAGVPAAVEREERERQGTGSGWTSTATAAWCARSRRTSWLHLDRDVPATGDDGGLGRGRRRIARLQN